MAPDILTRIPVELIFHIISFLHGNKPALSACSLCCSALAAVARPLLFHTLRTGLDSKAAGRFESLLESAPGVVPLIKRIDVGVPALEPATHQSAMIAISRIMLHPRVEETPPALGLTMWPVVPGSRRFGTTVPAHLDQWVTSLELNRLDFPPELHFWDFVLAFPKLESLTLGSVKVGERFQAIPSLKPKISHITFKQGTWDRISDVYSFLVHYTPPLPSLVSLDMRFPGVLGRLSIQFGEQYGPGVKNLRFGAVVTRDLQGDWGNMFVAFISKFSNLEALTFQGIYVPRVPPQMASVTFEWIPVVLHGVSSTLRKLTIEVVADHLSYLQNVPWSAIDEKLAHQLRSVTIVEILLATPIRTSYLLDNVYEEMERRLPLAAQRGVLCCSAVAGYPV